MSKREPARASGGHRAPGLYSTGRGLWMPLVFLGLLVAAVAWSWTSFVLRQQMEDYRRSLHAVSELKAQQLADWIELHRSGAEAIASGAWLGEQYEDWRETGHVGAADRVFVRLEQLAHAGRFSSVVLADRDGRPIWSSAGAHPVVDESTRAKWVAAAATGSAVLIGPYLDEDGHLHLDYVVAMPSARGPPEGIVLLHTGAEDYLPPRFGEFPLPLASGEVALIRRDGDSIVRLSWPAMHPEEALQTRTPLGEGWGAAAQLLLAQGPEQLVVQGPDQFGRDRMKSGHPVAGTDWMVITSIAIDEIRRESIGTVAGIGLLGVLLFFASGAIVIVLRQQRNLSRLIDQQHLQDADLRAFHLLKAVADSSRDPIFVKDHEGRYTLANRACCEFLGRPLDEVLGRTDRELFPADQADELMEIHRRIMDSGMVSATREVIDSGGVERVVTATKGPLYDVEGNLAGVFGIARDVTDDERAKQELESHAGELAQRNRELERFNEAMVGRELDMLRLKREVNALCEQLGEPPRYGRELIKVGEDIDLPGSTA